MNSDKIKYITKNLILFLTTIFVLSIFIGCKSKEVKNQSSQNGLSDTIVVYFSATGNTKKVAQIIADELHCGIYEIVPDEEYTKEDLDWKNPKSRVSKEHNNPSIRPSFGELMPALSIYKTLIIGYPIWYGEAPNIMKSYLDKNNDMPKDMRVIPFCTSGSMDISKSAEHLFKNIPVNLEKGKRFSANSTDEEIINWVKNDFK